MRGARTVRWACQLVAVLLSVTLALPRTAAVQTEFAPYSGELLYLSNGEIWRFDLATNEPHPFLRAPGGLITHLAHAPDRHRLAYAVTYFDRVYAARGAEIIVCDADGSNPRTVVQESESGYVVGWVSWAHDGGHLVYGKVNWGRGFVERVEEVELATGARTLLLESGAAPAASPTDPFLAYQRRVGTRWSIAVLDRRSGASVQVVDAAWFEDADHPRFSPDGRLVAFVAAGAGPMPTGDGLLHLASWGSEAAPRPLRATPPRHATARHDLIGVLFDLWVVQPDGGGLRRVAQLFDGNPEIAWSPSGRHIAALGSFQLQIVDVATGTTRSLPRPANTFFGGPLSWGTSLG